MREHEAELAPVEDLEDLYENAPCGYLSLRPDGRIFKVNKTISDWVGLSPTQLIGKFLPDFLNAPGRLFYETHFAPLLRQQGSFSEVPLDFTTTAGERLPVLVDALDRCGPDGRLLFTRITVFKATKRRLYQRELGEARATATAAVALMRAQNISAQEILAAEREISELREQFIAVLGHDLKNPLASIKGGARLLLREPQNEKAANILALMQSTVVRMTVLIDNVLDFARGRLGGGVTLTSNADMPLEPVLLQVVEELREGVASRVILTDFAVTDPVDCDRSRIGQLVSNLLGNALTHGAVDQPIRLHAATHDGMLELWVANAGTPISGATMERLFQPFFRGEVLVSQQGLGLGLYIAAEIAKAHGGALTVASSVTETRFTFLMPLVQPT